MLKLNTELSEIRVLAASVTAYIVLPQIHVKALSPIMVRGHGLSSEKMAAQLLDEILRSD